ncbi:MarR family winged helix-turn-helix transcriptional regulator [Mangrovibacterium sp.]|uniref:MarR family winged helix-turn-helix transcriptional regulator n=1 Tax=Mangrovibacterium sp. TaxID=1961364 RepID=UPI00356A5733
MEQLKLDNQLCFPFYSLSRLIVRKYQPYLDELEITYPQYLVLLVLWESDAMPVNDIAKRLILQTNTVTPLLKRMESQGIVVRDKSEDDERKVIVKLTEKGKKMELVAAEIPAKMAGGMNMSADELKNLHSTLYRLIDQLK